MVETKDAAPDAAGATPANRDAANWAQPVDRLSAAGRGRREGRRGHRQAGVRTAPGLRPAVAEVVQRPSRRNRHRSDGPHRALEGATSRRSGRRARRFYAPLSGIAPGEVALLEIQPVPGAPVTPVDRRPGPLRRRRVVHVHDPGRPYPVGVDHVLGATRRRRDGRPGAGARATVGSVRRAGLHARRQPPERQVLGGDAAQPRGVRRRQRRRSSRRRSSASTGTDSGATGGTSATAPPSGPLGAPLTAPVRKLTGRG